MARRNSFPGFSPEALDFFRKLEKNNQRDWFQPRKEEFERLLKAPMLELVDALNGELARFAPEHVNDPAKAVYRIYRDTRFSPDKTPYKTHVAANFPRRGFPRHACAGYYFEVSHRYVGIAGGVYMPGPEELLALRTRLSAEHAAFAKLLASKKLRSAAGELQGEELSRVPKGFRADDPAAGLLRKKQWYWWIELDSAVATTPKLVAELAGRFRAMAPAIDFLNAALVETRRKPEVYGAFGSRS